MVWEEVVSTIGLVLICVPFLLWGVLAPAWFNPKYITIVANYVLPPLMHFRWLSKDERVQPNEWISMMKSASNMDSMPVTKQHTMQTLMWMETLEHRLGASAFAGIAAGAIYALTQDFTDRHPIFFCFAVTSVFCAFVNFTHAIGTNNALTNDTGTRVGIVFSAAFWIPIAACMFIGLFGSRAAAGL